MKKLFINLIAMSLFTVGYSQINGNINEVTLDEVTVSGALNAPYLRSVRVEEMPPSVNRLETKAALFDITKSRKFKYDFEAYEVIFRQDKGKIIATYDKEGKIVKSFEKFDNIALPPAVRNKIWKENPGWAIKKDVYLVNYYGEQGVKRTCKVQITKDGEKKNLRLDIDDVL